MEKTIKNNPEGQKLLETISNQTQIRTNKRGLMLFEIWECPVVRGDQVESGKPQVYKQWRLLIPFTLHH